MNGSAETVGSEPAPTNDSRTDGDGTGVGVGAAVGAIATDVGVAVGAGVAVSIGAVGESDGIDAPAVGVLDGAEAEGVAVARVAEAAAASASEPIPMAATTRPASPRASSPRGRLGNPIFMSLSIPSVDEFYFRCRALWAAKQAEIGPKCRAQPADRRTITE